MKKQILSIVALVFFSTLALGSPCTEKSVAGQWSGKDVMEMPDFADCGWQVFTTTRSIQLSENGKGNGTEESHLEFQKPDICGESDPTTQEMTIRLSEKSSTFSVEYDDGKTYEFSCSMISSNAMEINGMVMTRQGSTPTLPNDPNAPFVPEICLNCDVLVHHHPLQYPPNGTPEMCNEKNIVGTWKETKDFTDDENNYCQWQHETVEVITIGKGVNQTNSPIITFNASGYIKGKHTLLKKEEGWSCKTIIEDREYTKVEMGKLNSGHTILGAITIHDLRPDPNYPKAPKLAAQDSFPGCTVYGGKFLVFGRAEKRRLEKQ